MSVSLERYNYIKSSHSYHHPPYHHHHPHKKFSPKSDFPVLVSKPHDKTAAKSLKNSTPNSLKPQITEVKTPSLTAPNPSLFKFAIKAAVDHPSHRLMAELRLDSKAMDGVNAWWAGHLAVSLQRRSATEVNTAGFRGRVKTFQCDDKGNVPSPGNYESGALICPPIPLRSAIYFHDGQSPPTPSAEIKKATHCMLTNIDYKDIAADVSKTGSGERNGQGAECVNLWTLDSMKRAISSLISQWKEQLHNCADTHFCYGGLEREYTCACSHSKRQLVSNSIVNMLAILNFDRPVEAELKVAYQHPLHPISGFELASLLFACAHEVRHPRTGSIEAIIFVNELLQHMLRSYESPFCNGGFNVLATVTLYGPDSPCVTLRATRAIKYGEILTAAFDRGIEPFNPHGCATRYQINRNPSPLEVNHLEKVALVKVVTARQFLRQVTYDPSALGADAMIVYVHATDALIAMLRSVSKLSKEFKGYVKPMLENILTLLDIPHHQVGDANTINRRHREARALAFWIRTFNVAAAANNT